MTLPVDVELTGTELSSDPLRLVELLLADEELLALIVEVWVEIPLPVELLWLVVVPVAPMPGPSTDDCAVPVLSEYVDSAVLTVLL